VSYCNKLKLQCNITKIRQLIPQIIEEYCKQENIPNNYQHKVEERVKRNYNGRIQCRCMEHYLIPDEERTFTPKLKDLVYSENENTTDEEEEEHDTDDFHLYSTTSNSDDESSNSEDSNSSSSDSSDLTKQTSKERNKQNSK
jgi:hypothetical protein